MPIYEYYCQKCDAVRELWQSTYDTDAKECPDCRIPMDKLISRSSFQLRGGGWYTDGYCKNVKDNSSDKKRAEGTTCSMAGNEKNPACTSCSS